MARRSSLARVAGRHRRAGWSKTMSAPRRSHSHRRSRIVIGMLLLGATAAFVWLPRHRYHVLGFLPYLLLLACPLAHVFMHRGHRHRDASGNATPPDAGDDDARHRSTVGSRACVSRAREAGRKSATSNDGSPPMR
ncbi:hypothetical protein AQ477_16810 [Burkholderia thailandensis]|nr:hypothetical protein AQ477_16810 [Burkholderia thailandensis]KXF61114.1 hypothetical protein AQ476_07300 [Burkholderia thailandensis]